MDFPITDLMSEKASTEWILEYFHPQGLACPHCGAAWAEASEFRTMRMIRKGGWKLIIDMQGEGQLYHLADDPVELVNLYDQPEYATVQQALLTDLVVWMLRVQDPLPHPRRRYKFKPPPHGYWTSGE